MCVYICGGDVRVVMEEKEKKNINYLLIIRVMTFVSD